MTRSARLLAAAIARASSRTAVGAAAAPLLPTTGALAAASPLLLSPPFPMLRRDQPSPPTSLDWARSYAKGARGGGGGKKGGGGGGGKKGKRGARPVSDEDDEDDEDDDEDAEQSGDEEDADEDPLKLDEIEGMMKAALEHYSHELAGVRTGRANPGLIENLPVLTETPPSSSSGSDNNKSSSRHHQPQHHGHAHVPLRALGTVTVRDPQTLAVSVYDPAMAGAVARAIQNSPLGLSAVAGGGADGATTGGSGKKQQQQSSEVLVRLPRMTREVVERMVKLVHAEGEGALVSIRRARQKALDAAKRAYGGGGGGGGGNKSSDLQRAEKAVAALVEKYNGEVERMKKLKDKELREHRD